MAIMHMKSKNRSKSLSLMREMEEILSRRSMRSRMNRVVKNLRRVEEENDKESFINHLNQNN